MRGFLSAIIIFSVLLVGCQSNKGISISGDEQASSLKSMKGWELYSWQKPEGWCYALVMGTNRIKTYEEISAIDVAILGLVSDLLNITTQPGRFILLQILTCLITLSIQ
jgi:hypothetical protein